MHALARASVCVCGVCVRAGCVIGFTRKQVQILQNSAKTNSLCHCHVVLAEGGVVAQGDDQLLVTVVHGALRQLVLTVWNRGSAVQVRVRDVHATRHSQTISSSEQNNHCSN